MNIPFDHIARWLADGGGNSLESRRIFHGRGGCLEGWEHVVVDWFHPVLVITLFAPWDDVADFVEALPKTALPNIVLQRRYLRGAPTEVLRGGIPDEMCAREDGLRFALNLKGNQNHGFFLDMRPAREWLRDCVEGKRVLNLFSYTCAFSVVALAAGAESVVNLDMAKGALNTGRKNHRLNLPDEVVKGAQFLAHDLFKSWGKLRRFGPFDLIIVDPPSFQRGAFVAEKDYPRVIRQLSSLLSGGDAIVLACLNAPELSEEFLIEQFSIGCPEAVYDGRLSAHPDFPDHDEAKSLKAQVFRLGDDGGN